MNVSRVIYEMIDVLLCHQNKDPNEDAIQLLFKCLLPKLVAASVDNRSANVSGIRNISAPGCPIFDIPIRFVKKIMFGKLSNSKNKPLGCRV